MLKELLEMHGVSFGKILRKIFGFAFTQCLKKAAFCKDHAISVGHCPLNYSNE